MGHHHLSLFENFYLKKTELDEKRSIVPSKKAVSMNRATNEIEYNWNVPDSKPFSFRIPSTKDELTGEDLTKLNHVSFINSVLYLTDSIYYSGLTEQKRADCLEFMEILRKDFYSKHKISKETATILQNIENPIYADVTVQHIVSFLNSFHLLLFSNDTSSPPKLFINGGRKENNYRSAGALIMLYLDETREIYYPILYKEDTMYLTWKDQEYIQLMKQVFLWGKPTETKKWAVSDLREWIRFFELPIDSALDKKTILEKLPEKMSSV